MFCIDALERFIDGYVPLFKAIEHISETEIEAGKTRLETHMDITLAQRISEFNIALVTVRILLCYNKSATFSFRVIV